MTRSRSRAWFKPVVAFAIAVAITTGAWVGLSADVFFATQLRFSDALFPGAVADDRIVIVEIDEESIARSEERWPWPRSLDAELIDELTANGASLIGYDVTFAARSDDRAQDEALAAAIRDAGRVVLDPEHTLDAEEDRGQFQPVIAPPKAAGYAPVEPVGAPAESASEASGPPSGA